MQVHTAFSEEVVTSNAYRYIHSVEQIDMDTLSVTQAVSARRVHMFQNICHFQAARY
jgi:hypothetical protein